MPEAEHLKSANASSAQRPSFFQMKARLSCTLKLQLRGMEWVNELYREIKSVSKCAISQTTGNNGTKYSVEDSSSFCKMYA